MNQKSRVSWVLLVTIAGLFHAHWAIAQAPESPTFKEDILNRLESDDAAVRNYARQQLTEIANFWRQPDMVRQLIDSTVDPALKQMFRDRLAMMESLIAENQLVARYEPENIQPVSMSLRDANFSAFSSELKRQIAAPLVTVLSGPDNNTAKSDIIVKDKPFWEAVKELQKIQPFDFSFNGTSNLMSTVGTNPMVHSHISGPAILYAGTPTYRRINNFLADEKTARSATLSIPLTLAIDPRVRVVRYAPIKISRITDETGKEIFSAEAGEIQLSLQPSHSMVNKTTPTLNLATEPGKRLTFFCETKVEVAKTVLSTIIPDVQKNLNRRAMIGGWDVAVTGFSVSEKPPQAKMQVSMSNKRPAPIPGIPVQERISLKITAADGKALWESDRIGTGGTPTIPLSNTKGPYILTATKVGESETLTFRFELKDVRLP